MCSHPALLPEYAPAAEEGSAATTPAGTPSVKVEGMSASTPSPSLSSGKLRLMMQLLPALHASGHRVLVLSQSQKVRDRRSLRSEINHLIIAQPCNVIQGYTIV